MPNMVHTIVEDLFIVLHRAKPPTDEEWMIYLRSWRPVDMARMRTLVFTDGGGPNAAQRRAANEALAGKASLTAVVSSSSIVRGMVTALSWFNPKIKAFNPEETAQAFTYLGSTTPQEIARIWITVERLKEALGEGSLKSIVRQAA